MALFPKTPGVYIQEISTLPASVVAVPTAVPVFIGYTQKGTAGAVMDPVRITSLIEYQENFGGAFLHPYSADVNNVGTSIATIGTPQPFTLFPNLQMFYANGGGNCYIISIGNYADTIVKQDFMDGIVVAEKADEPTIVLAPEAVALTAAGEFKDVNDAMLAHCAKMQDRFAVVDVKHSGTNTPNQDAVAFRGFDVGANNLKYGACYYPPLNTTLIRPYSELSISVLDTRTGVGLPVYTDGAGGPYNNLFSIRNGYATWARINTTTALAGSVTINGILFTGSDYANAEELRNAINSNPTVTSSVVAILAGQAANRMALIATNSSISPTAFTLSGSIADPITAGIGGKIDTGLYNDFVAKLNANTLTLNPGSAMAGIYTAVDNDRGVWKAPANVSVSLVKSLSVTVTDNDQADLNVDATSGKSINAIRDFTGRGTLVWGARTLDGNSNEWRYVPVRRLFIFVEESCKKASEFVVFEPNDKNTWIRVKSMISNFLADLWKQGALAGDKPEQAFFVMVGLGETMSAQDILEGKLIVRIGMAAVRPAEFIILNFEHKLQEA